MHKAFRLFFLSLIFLLGSINLYCQNSFTEVAEILNIDHQYCTSSGGGGVSFYDFNNDGWDDLTFASCEGEEIHFYQNNSGTFERIIPSPIENTLEAKHILWADFDNDGDADLFITSFQENHLYRNNGQFEFEEITEQVNLPITLEPTYGAIWGDYDRDGWLDLYVTDKKLGDDFDNTSNHLYRNIKGQNFIEVTAITNTADSSKAPFCGAFMDVNNDGWQDIYIAQDRLQINTMLKNLGDGTFEDISTSSETNLSMNAMCVTIGDYNNDQNQDIYVTNTPDGNALLRNNGNETFTELAAQSGVGFFNTGWSSSFFDYNNDGLLDLYVCNMSGPNFFYKNIDKENFETLTDIGFDKDTVTSFSNAIGDFNNDGFPDIVVGNADYYPSTLWQNPGSYNNNWFKVSLTGVYSNRDGVGSRIEVFCGEDVYSRYTHSGIGYLAQDSQHNLFGVGNHEVIDSLKIYWISGIIDSFYDVPVNNKMNIIEGESTSISPVINIHENADICNGDSLRLNCGYYGKSFKFLWSNGAKSDQIIVKEEGTYYVEIEDINGNKITSNTITVNILDGPTISNSIIKDPACFNDSNGAIQLEINGGHPPYIFNWSNGETKNHIENLTAGHYEVEIIDDNGCSISESFELLNPEKINVSYNTIAENDEQKNGSISLKVFGGIPPYSFFWGVDQIEGYSLLTDLSAGIYEVKIIDSQECETNLAIEVLAIFTTGLKEGEAQAEIYPNPSNEYLYINIRDSKKKTIIISDLVGRIHLQKEIQRSERINLSHIKSGLYFLHIGDYSIKKLVIQH